MKTALAVARLLLGLTFVVFGLNGFFQFIPAPPLSGLGGAFSGALLASHYTILVSADRCLHTALAGLFLRDGRLSAFIPLRS